MSFGDYSRLVVKLDGPCKQMKAIRTCSTVNRTGHHLGAVISASAMPNAFVKVTDELTFLHRVNFTGEFDRLSA
jgi:hypothetical protein